MTSVAYLPIVADRYGPLVRHLYVAGLDLTGVTMRAQVRFSGDSPGDPYVDLLTVTNGNAQGLRLVEVTTDAQGLPTSHIEIVINETTMEGLPYAGELGDAVQFAWDMQITIGGRKRRLAKGEFEITGDGVTGADAAPINRPIGYGRPVQPVTSPWKAARLTFGEEQVTVQIVDADLVAPLAKAAADAKAESQEASAISSAKAGEASLSAATALAAIGGIMYPTTAAGLAAVVANAFFTVVGDGDSTFAVLYQKVNGAAVEKARYASKAAYEGPNGFTLIRYKRPDAGTFARTAAQRVLAGIGDDGLFVNEWIDPELDPLISHSSQSVEVDLSAAFNAAISTGSSLISRGSLGEVSIANGFYTVGHTIRTGWQKLSLVGKGRVLIQQMANFTDDGVGQSTEIQRPRIFSCDYHDAAEPAYIRNHKLENIIVRGNGTASDAFHDRGVANSERVNLKARNIGGAVQVALACVDNYYSRLQSVYVAEGRPEDQRPKWGLVVGRALVPAIGGSVAQTVTTQCAFNVRFEEADIAGILLSYADTCQFTGMAEGLQGAGVILDAPAVDNIFSHFYCEKNGGYDWDISGSRNLVHEHCTSYNSRDDVSIRIRSGAFLNSFENFGNPLTKIQIDAGATHTQLRNITAKQIINNGADTHRSGYIYDLTQSGAPQYA